MKHRVVIVGGGFGGLQAARSLARVAVDVVLVDRRNHHLFQPLLYQVATGTLSPANIAAPLRSLVRRQRNTRVLLTEARGIDISQRRLTCRDVELDYDTLILAAGSSHSYFGHPEWESAAPGLKSIEDATAIRARILTAFERAEREQDPETIRRCLTFLIVGGGPTGVELAGALAEISRHTLGRDFRGINPADARILLVEGMDRILGGFTPDLSARAQRALEKLGVTVLTGATATRVTHDGVELSQGQGSTWVPAATVLWAAGVQASPLGRLLSQATGTPLDRAGRAVVNADLSIPGHPEILVIGDMAHFALGEGRQLPALAPVAIQQGRYVANLIAARLAGRALPPFRYRDRGSMATIGRFKAVADVRGWRFSGLLAWLAWLLVHLMAIVQFHNRLLVLMQWSWHYTTWNRSARLITGEASSEPAASGGSSPPASSAAEANPDPPPATLRSV